MRVEKNKNVSFNAHVKIAKYGANPERSFAELEKSLKRIGGKKVEHIIEQMGEGMTKFTTKYALEDVGGDVMIKIPRQLTLHHDESTTPTSNIIKMIIDFAKGTESWIDNLEKNKKIIDYTRWKKAFYQSESDFVG